MVVKSLRHSSSTIELIQETVLDLQGVKPIVLIFAQSAAYQFYLVAWQYGLIVFNQQANVQKTINWNAQLMQTKVLNTYLAVLTSEGLTVYNIAQNFEAMPCLPHSDLRSITFDEGNLQVVIATTEYSILRFQLASQCTLLSKHPKNRGENVLVAG